MYNSLLNLCDCEYHEEQLTLFDMIQKFGTVEVEYIYH